MDRDSVYRKARIARAAPCFLDCRHGGMDSVQRAMPQGDNVNSFERYMGMVRGETVDVLPRIPILMHFAARYAGITYADFAGQPEAMIAANIKLVEDFGFEQLDVMSDPYRETTAFGAELLYREDGPPHLVRPPLEDSKDLSRLKTLEPKTAPRLRDCLRVLEGYKAYGYQRYSITGWVEGPAASAANLRGVQTFLLDFYEDEEFACALMERALEGAIRFAEVQIESGADTIGVGDAVASQLPTDLYERLVAPREKRLVEAIHAAGGLARLHICGDTSHLLQGMAGTGFDIVDLDWNVDMRHARSVLGDAVTLGGNLNPVSAILESDPEAIHLAFQSIYRSVGRPYMVNAGCEIPGATPYENLRALCRPIPVDVSGA